MKALRVISGLHAGAWLPLAPGQYCIGRGEATAPETESPLRLYDWTGEPLVLVVEPEGAILTFRPVNPPVPGASERGESWPDLQPRRYGEVVLCVGEDDQSWPSDAQLLSMRQVPAASGKSPLPSWMRSWSARALVVGAGLLVAVGALYGRSNGSPPELRPPQPALGVQWLSHSLQRQGLQELEVRQERRDVALSGLVRNAEQARMVRLAVAEVQRGMGIPVNESWEVADEIASTIESALRVPGLQARYLGDGRFEVSGAVVNPTQLKHAAPQLQKDLGANVRGIEFLLEGIQTTPAFSVAIAADALHYSQRPDGAKVFSGKTP